MEREKVQTKEVTQDKSWADRKWVLPIIIDSKSKSDLLPCFPNNPLYLPQSFLAQPLRTGELSLPWNVGSFSLGVISVGVSNSSQLNLRFFCGLCDHLLCVPWHELRKNNFIFPVLWTSSPCFCWHHFDLKLCHLKRTDPGLFSAINGHSVEYLETVSQITKTKI